MQRPVLINLIVCFIMSLSGKAYGDTHFNDGGQHTIDYIIAFNVYVDWETPGAGTQLELVDGGSITSSLYAYEDSYVTILGGSVIYSLRAFDNSRVTISGGAIGSSLILYDNSRATVSGGSMSSLLSYDNSHAFVSGGSFFFIGASGDSSLTFSSGSVRSNLAASQNSEVTASGGSIQTQLIATGNSRVTMSGNLMTDEVWGYENSEVTISDGSIADTLGTLDNCRITVSGSTISGDIWVGSYLSNWDVGSVTFVGSDFAIDGIPVDYGQYFASDYASGVLCGTLDNGDILNNRFRIYDDASIIFMAGAHNTIPIACIVGGNRIVEADSNCEVRVVLDGSCSSDEDSTPGTNDDINDFDWYEIIDPCDANSDIYLGSGEIIECNLPLGEHTILLEVTDTAGASDSNQVIITVVDVTPPEFSLSVEPNVLWPVNHKMVEIRSSWEVSDNCDEWVEVSLVSITINEDDDEIGGGHTIGDIWVDANDELQLRAERSGKGTGRVYTITYQAVDDSNNVTVDSAIVTVPHDMR